MGFYWLKHVKCGHYFNEEMLCRHERRPDVRVLRERYV